MKLGEMSRDGLADRIERLEVEREKLRNRVAELEAEIRAKEMAEFERMKRYRSIETEDSR